MAKKTDKKVNGLIEELKGLAVDGSLEAKDFNEKVKAENLSQEDCQQILMALVGQGISLSGVENFSAQQENDNKLKDIVAEIKSGIAKSGSVESGVLYDTLATMKLTSEEVDTIFNLISEFHFTLSGTKFYIFIFHEHIY